MSRLWRWRRSREQRGSAELLVSHQEDKMHFDIFAILVVPLTSSSNNVVCQDLATGWSAPCWTGSWGRWRTTWPASRRCSATSSTPSPPLSARQTTPPPPFSYTLGRKVFHPATGFSLAPHSFTGTTPVTPLLQNPCCSKQLYTPCIIIGMWYWLLMCFIESQTVHTCCPLFFVLGAFFRQLNVKISKKEYKVGIFSQLCIMIRLVVGFWDFWELFSWLRYPTSRFYASNVFSSILAQTFAICCDKTNKASQQKMTFLLL